MLKTKSKYWIIEKIIEQNSNSITEMCNILKPFKCWVDMPRRGIKEYLLIKNILRKKKLINVNLRVTMFGERIITSSVHMIDIMCWLLNTSIKNVITKNLNRKWIESKRKGFFDIGGKLVVLLKNNSKIILKTSKNPKSGDIIIGNNYFNLNINETRGNIITSEGKKIKLVTPHVSIIMTKIITEILLKGNTKLPSLSESIEDHKILIDNLKLYWERRHAKKIKNLPVT